MLTLGKGANRLQLYPAQAWSKLEAAAADSQFPGLIPWKTSPQVPLKHCSFVLLSLSFALIQGKR